MLAFILLVQLITPVSVYDVVDNDLTFREPPGFDIQCIYNGLK